ncbi:MAG: hypothetical protein CSA75_02125 [Sorangium cellulosum]|nr:MAG: hypothetical protein CSA75_02125 [Sorangium cellulosum]
MMRCFVAAMLLFILCAVAEGVADAQPGEPISTNRYNVEVFQGPVLAPQHVTGLAGAYTAFAEGVDGIPANPAAAAVRKPYSFDSFDWDLSAGLSFPATFRHTDFDNDGNIGFFYDDFIFYNAGGMLQWGSAGGGILGDAQTYNITPNALSLLDPKSELNVRRVDASVGWAFWNHQFVVGVGVRVIWLNVQNSTFEHGTDTLVSMSGMAPQFGALIRPDFEPWRLGLTYRAAVRGEVADPEAGTIGTDGVRRAAGLAIPHSIHVPWEVRAGFSIQLGPRPLNPSWLNPVSQEQEARERVATLRKERSRAKTRELDAIADPTSRARRASVLNQEEAYLRQKEEQQLEKLVERMRSERRARYWNWPRPYILIVAEALITGPSPNAVSMESFLSQRAKRAGQDYSVTPRLGLEGEPVVEHIKSRIGTYIEPSRFRGRNYRQHFTFGIDVRMFELRAWGLLNGHYRISAMADLAPRYESFGLSLGIWH